MEFEYKKTNKSVFDAKRVKGDKRNKEAITDINFRVRWKASKFKKENHEKLFQNPFFHVIFQGDIRTVRQAPTSDYCYIEWKEYGKWAWVKMSYINAFGSKDEIKFFKTQAKLFYPNINFDNITDIITPQNYLSEYNNDNDSNDSDDSDDSDDDMDDDDDDNDNNKRNKNIKSRERACKKNKHIKSNRNNNNDIDSNDSDDMDDDDNDSNKKNKKNKNIKSRPHAHKENKHIKSNRNNNKNRNNNNNSILKCPYCNEFSFDIYEVEEFKTHISNNHPQIGFWDARRQTIDLPTESPKTK